MSGFKKAEKTRSGPPGFCDLCQSAHYAHEAHSFRSKPVVQPPGEAQPKKIRPLAKGKKR